jgi:hypothetical protein
VHALRDPELARKLARFVASGKPVLLTDGLAGQLSGKMNLTAANVQFLPVKGDPKSLLELGQTSLDALRAKLLARLGIAFKAPARVALYRFDDGSWVIENFNDQAVTVDLDGPSRQVAPRGWAMQWKPTNK